MARQWDPFWDYVEKLDDGPFKCTFCGHKFSTVTSVTRIRLHLSGVQGRGVAICRQVPEDVQEAAFQAVHGGNKRHKGIASSSNFNDDIENGTGGVAQPGAGGSSSEGLTGNTNETPGDPLHTSLHVEVDNVAPQGQHLERVFGHPVVRGSAHDEPQEDSSQPTDPPFLTHGRYHDQLCPPLVNMVEDPGQPVVRHSSREALQPNGDEIGRDVFLTEELTGGEFENNKNAIWSWIMNDEASSSIGIYGMGGVGKTTLLTHIYNQLLQEPDTFPHVHWITVSRDFSVYKLQNLIAKDIHLDLSNEDNKRKRAAKLSEALINEQRWVLILDDLWNCFDFDEVGIPIQVKGCKLILTTRSFEVCQRMVCQKTIQVEPLSVEEAWALFIKILGCIPPEAEEIAKSVASECAGLPLGIKTMAGTMRGVDDICEWRNALEVLKQSRFWQENMDEKVFHILRFSFMHLKESELQQCFLCCALFPEDFKIPIKDLIAYLIDEGVIKGLKSREAEFNKGLSMVDKLERVCLLKRINGGSAVKMHDMIRDIAIQIYKEKHSSVMVETGRTTSKFLFDQDQRRSWIKIISVWTLVMTNLILEIASAFFDQLGYAPIGMVLAFVALLLATAELIYMARKDRMDQLPISHRPSTSNSAPGKPVVTIVEYFGLVGAAWQCFYSTVEYTYARQNKNNPIKMCLLPFIFLLCVVFSKLIKKEFR